MKQIKALGLSFTSLALILIAAGSLELSQPFSVYIVPFCCGVALAVKSARLWDDYQEEEQQ